MIRITAIYVYICGNSKQYYISLTKRYITLETERL